MEHIGTLHPNPPYRFDLLLEMLARFTHPSLDHAYDEAYWRALHTGDGLALVCVRGRDGDDSPALDVYLAAARGAVDRTALLAAVEHILACRVDARDFYQFARSDAALWALVEPLAGLSWVRAPTAFEALAITIIEQQIAWVAAQKAHRWLVEWGGHRLDYDGLTAYAFPTPQQIAAASVEEFTPLKITFRRMRLLIEVAGMVSAGHLPVEDIRALPPDDAYQMLLALRGVGHWTACWTITRTQGARHTYVGYNDVALQAAVNRYFYGGEGRIPAEQVAQTFARYGQYAGLAAHYTILRWVLDKYQG